MAQRRLHFFSFGAAFNCGILATPIAVLQATEKLGPIDSGEVIVGVGAVAFFYLLGGLIGPWVGRFRH